MRQFACVAVLLVGSLTAACSPASPSANQTETFVGTLAVGAVRGNVHFFVVSKGGSREYSVTLTSLVPPSPGLPLAFVLGMGTASSGCNTSSQPSYAATGMQALSGPISPGSYCLVIYDPGTLVVNEQYTVTLSHP
jgi:hypothetical protein